MSTTEQQEITIPAGTYGADRVHSTVAFEVGYMGIGLFGGAVQDFEASLSDGRLAGKARIESLETKDENLHAHLMAPDWFDAERHPEVSFSTEQAKAEGDEVVFEGELTIKGITRPATLTGTIVGPVSDPYGNERYGLKLETSIDRTAFGLDWNNDMPDGSKALADEVTLKAELSLVKAA
ncbi:MAG TPA: YceI family protein [Gaiellaceae bacterium]|nr:YceI family protein [Gaiellaceae bacterium]